MGLPDDVRGWDRLKRPIWIFDPASRRGLYANPPALALWGAGVEGARAVWCPQRDAWERFAFAGAGVADEPVRGAGTLHVSVGAGVGPSGSTAVALSVTAEPTAVLIAAGHVTTGARAGHTPPSSVMPSQSSSIMLQTSVPAVVPLAERELSAWYPWFTSRAVEPLFLDAPKSLFVTTTVDAEVPQGEPLLLVTWGAEQSTVLRATGERVQVRTFHSWCADVVNSYQLQVPPGGDQDERFRRLVAVVERPRLRVRPRWAVLLFAAALLGSAAVLRLCPSHEEDGARLRTLAESATGSAAEVVAQGTRAARRHPGTWRIPFPTTAA